MTCNVYVMHVITCNNILGVSLMSCCCGLDCVLRYRVRDLSVGFDLGFPPLLRAGNCERWAQSEE